MNHRPNQSNPTEPEKTQKSSLPSGIEQSDSKEILFLAGGLITLTLGLGGLFMFSADDPSPVPLSQEAAKKVSTFQMAEAFATPATPIPSDSPSLLPDEPSIHAVKNAPEVEEFVDTDVYFEFNRWTLSDGAKSLLKTQVTAQGDEWMGTFHIDGHTDAQGPDTYNRALGLKRAEAVKTYLLSLGISKDRIQVKSFGKDGAVCQEQTPDCFEHNRRAHIAFLSQPVVQQHDSLLSISFDESENSLPESTSSRTDSLAIDATQTELHIQDDLPGELEVNEPLASLKSAP